VIVSSNLFGDILSDLGPATTGTIAIAPGANINPEREFPSMFEPVHGSAPDIAGKSVANPRYSALMLAHLGQKAAADCIVSLFAETDVRTRTWAARPHAQNLVQRS
jgi:tartrate dehydrogenase/decarboxylase / D-malate dehydrogenase